MAVIGAGWIGAEVAASARQKGLEVTLIEQLDVPLERVLGREVGEVYGAIHRDQGVELLTGVAVEAIEGSGRAERVRLAGGDTVDCDFVVVGIGVAPRVGAGRGGRARGRRRDPGGRPAEARRHENVFAAGDVAGAWHPFFEQRLRVEHWHNALEQGPAAARSMLGVGEPYDKLPYFFSDQYDVGMEYAGHATDWDEVVFRGDVDAREFIAFWLKDGRVLAGMNVNVWDVTDDIQALIRSRTQVDRHRRERPRHQPPRPDLAGCAGGFDPRERLGAVGDGLGPGDADDAFACGFEDGLLLGVVFAGEAVVVPFGSVGLDDQVLVGPAEVGDQLCGRRG